MFSCFGRSSKKGKDVADSDSTDVPRKSQKKGQAACPSFGELVHLQHWEDVARSSSVHGLAAVVRVSEGGSLLACSSVPPSLTPASYAQLLTDFADKDALFRAALESFCSLQNGASAHLCPMTLEMATPPSWKASIRTSDGISCDRIRMHYTTARKSSSSAVPALHIEHLPASSQLMASMPPVASHSASELVPRLPNYSFPPSERGSGLTSRELMTPTRWRRAQIMQAEVPVLLTLISQEGCVLEQNYNSIMYFGSIVGQFMWKETLGSKGSEHERPGTLEQLFEHAPEALEEVIEHLMHPENGPWKGTVQVKARGLDRTSRAKSAYVGPTSASARCSLPSARTTPLHVAHSSAGTGKSGLHLPLTSEDASASAEHGCPSRQGCGSGNEEPVRNESWDTASPRPGSHGPTSYGSGSYKAWAPQHRCSAHPPSAPSARTLNPRLSKSCSYVREEVAAQRQQPERSQPSSRTSYALPAAPVSLGQFGRYSSLDSREAEAIGPVVGPGSAPPMPLERLHRNSSIGGNAPNRGNQQNSRLASQLAAKMMHHSFHERVHLSYQVSAEQQLQPRRPSEALPSDASFVTSTHMPSISTGFRQTPLGTAEAETPDYLSMSQVHQSVAHLEQQATGATLGGRSYSSSQHGRQQFGSRHHSMSQEHQCVARSESQATVAAFAGTSYSSSQRGRRHSDARLHSPPELAGNCSLRTSPTQRAQSAAGGHVPELQLPQQQQNQQQQQQQNRQPLQLPKRRHSESLPMRLSEQLQQQHHHKHEQMKVQTGPGSVDRHPRVRFSGCGATLDPGGEAQPSQPQHQEGGDSKRTSGRPLSTSSLTGGSVFHQASQASRTGSSGEKAVQPQQQQEQEGGRVQSQDPEGSFEEGQSIMLPEPSTDGGDTSRARSRQRSHSNLLNQLDLDPPAQDKPMMYHEVEVKLVTDPETDRPAFLLLQRDVSEQVELENLLSELTEDQLAMLSQIFPRHVIHALSTDGAVTLDNIADLTCSHADVTILFLDIVSFTSTCGKDTVTPESVITFLNILFSRFDKLVQKYQVQKIDTIGDAYLVASGILAPDEDGFWAVDEFHDAALGAERMLSLAVDMMRAALEVRMPDDQPVKLRIGLHTGPCVSGLVGLDVPKWSVFGDTVNTAARLEQTALPTTIQISNATKSLLPDLDLKFVHNGAVAMKGKGTMETWLWHSPQEWARAWEGDEVPPLPFEIEELHRLCMPHPGTESGPIEEGEEDEVEEEYFQDFQEDAPRNAQPEKGSSFNFLDAGILAPDQGAPSSPRPIANPTANGVANAGIIRSELQAVVVEDGVMLSTALHEEGLIRNSSSGMLPTTQTEHRAECLMNRSSHSLSRIGGQLAPGHSAARMLCISASTSNTPDNAVVRGPLQQEQQQQQGAGGERRRRSKNEGRRFSKEEGRRSSKEGLQEGGGSDEGTGLTAELSGNRHATLPFRCRESHSRGPALSPISSVSSGVVDTSSWNRLYVLPEDLQASTQDSNNRSKDLLSFSLYHIPHLSSGNVTGQSKALGSSFAQVMSLRSSLDSQNPSCSNTPLLKESRLPGAASHVADGARQSCPIDTISKGAVGPRGNSSLHSRNSDPTHKLAASQQGADVPEEWRKLWEARVQGKHVVLAWTPLAHNRPAAGTRASPDSNSKKLLNHQPSRGSQSSSSDTSSIVAASMPCAQWGNSKSHAVGSRNSAQASGSNAMKKYLAHAQKQDGVTNDKDTFSMPLMFRIPEAPAQGQQEEQEEDHSSVGNAAGKSRVANLASKLVLSNKAGFGAHRLNSARASALSTALQVNGPSSTRRQASLNTPNQSTSQSTSNAIFNQTRSHGSFSAANNIYKGLAKAHAHIGGAPTGPQQQHEQQQQQQRQRRGSGRQRRGSLVLSPNQLSALQSLQE